jgi:hypothetical protein
VLKHRQGLQPFVSTRQPAASCVCVCLHCTGGGQLAAVLERSLASSLAQPLHEALRENFAASIIPAFERATQVRTESRRRGWPCLCLS